MTKFSLICIYLCLTLVCFGQTEIVKWSYETEQISDHEVVITFEADIEKGWKLYSQHTESGGPLPTNFSVLPGEGVEIIGNVKELSMAKTNHSELFEIDVTSFMNKAKFTQKINTQKGGSEVYATIKFMCCDGVKCIPPTEKKFTIAL